MPLISSQSKHLKGFSVKVGFLFSALLLLYFFAQPVKTAATALPPDHQLNEAVTTLIASHQHPLLLKADFSKQAPELAQLYRMTNNHLLWLEDNDASATLAAALQILRHADEQGLDPRDYNAELLSADLQRVLGLPQDSTAERVAFDTALSIAWLRFMHDLHDGRIAPPQLDLPNALAPKPAIDGATLLKQALEQQHLPALVQQLEPKIKQYQQLKQALADYRQRPAEADSPKLSFKKSLRPGESHPQLALLRARLTAVGVLPAQTPANFTDINYSGDLLEGVKTFQLQQGLDADGIIGKETEALLNQTLAEKITQIELAMERLRWLPADLSGPLIIVNIPAFELRAFHSLNEQETLNMKVIVGKAEQNPTPQLFEEMKYLEFMPYWNIPKSIMDKEILPKLEDDFTYLQNQDIELVQRSADASLAIDDVFDNIRSGKLRARQRPGKKNPLGKVKFIFPNKEDVYLHDTPAHSLFNRSRRDFSHGCVRVAQAEKLAEFVLSNQAGWDKQSIQEAMNAETTRRVTLKQTIPVLFFYTTSFVGADNQLRFYRDIYGQDAILQKALGKSAPQGDSLLSGQSATAG